MYYVYSSIQRSMLIQTRIRRTHLGIRYDIYVNGNYRATAQTAKEIEPLLARIADTVPMQTV